MRLDKNKNEMESVSFIAPISQLQEHCKLGTSQARRQVALNINVR